METSTVASSASATVSVPPLLLVVPPEASTRTAAWNLTLPAMPWESALTPSSAAVSGSGEESEVCCGLSKVAAKAIRPGWSAVSRTAMTWSGALANVTSR